MKRILPFLLVIMSQLPVFSQTFSITTGNSDSKWLSAGDFTLADEDAFYSSGHIEGSSSSFVLTKYSSSTMDQVYQQKIKVPEVNGKECEVKKLILVDGSLILFTTQLDKSDGLHKLYANKFNEDGTLSSESKLIASIKPANKKLEGFFKVVTAENKKNIIVLSEMASTETENIKHNWRILDKDLDLILENSLELPYYGIDEPTVPEMNYMHDKVYFIAWRLKHILDKKERDKTTSERKLYCFDLKSSKLTEVALNTESYSLFDVCIKFNSNGQVILTGLYSTEPGSFFYNTNSFYRKEAGAFCEVYNDNLEKLIYKEQIPNDWDGYLFYLNDVFIQNDGTVMLVSEKKDISVGYGGSKPSVHLSGNVLVYAFNPTTRQNWLKVITKRQEDSGMNNFFSTLTLSDGSDLAFVINDNRKNHLGAGLKFENFGLIDKNVQTKVLIADTEGEIKEDSSVTEFSGNYLIYCMINIRISASEMIVSVKTEEGARLAKITLN